MGELTIRYDTLALSQQLLQRQQRHATAIGDHVTSHGDLADASGWLLAAFDPLSRAAVTTAGYATQVLGDLDAHLAGAVGSTAVDIADQDGQVAGFFSHLHRSVGGDPDQSPSPDLQGPPLPPAAERAPEGYGDPRPALFNLHTPVIVQGFGDLAESTRGVIDEAQRLRDRLEAWNGPTSVGERVAPRSYLVAPQARDDFVQNLRWNAGLILGSIDWVAEQLLGYSLLQRWVYSPLAGDWQGIYRASEAWSHGADALHGVARNHAGLVADTAASWQGASGDAFRGAMTAVSGATAGLSTAFDYVSGLIKTISTACKLACAGIGKALDIAATVLLKKAAEAAVPVAGWAVGAVTAYSDINKLVGAVRMVTTLLDTVHQAILDFVEAKEKLLANYGLVEDLAQGYYQRARA